MKGELLDILNPLGYPVFLQGSLSPDEAYPDSFFTFWNFSTPEAAFYDNSPGRAVWGFWIYFYSIDPHLVESVPEEARQALRAAGWILDGRAKDAAVDRPTHTGAMFTAYQWEYYS